MKNLFEPCSIGNLTLKNRIIRAATHEGMAHLDGMPAMMSLIDSSQPGQPEAMARDLAERPGEPASLV